MNNMFNNVFSVPSRSKWTHQEKIKFLRLKYNEGYSLHDLSILYKIPPYEVREIIEDISQEVIFNRSEKRLTKRKMS